MKGPSETAAQAENAAKLLGGAVVGEEQYTLPTAGDRRIIRIEKVSATPKNTLAAAIRSRNSRWCELT